jgi:hypothetical protein
VSAPVAYVVTFQPAPGRDGISDLRFLLKIAGRHLHLRAIDIREQQTARRRDARRRPVRSASVGALTMTNLRRFGPQDRYIKLEDRKDKPPLFERIGLVDIDTTGKFGERIVLTFEPSGLKLSLNATSVGNLLQDFGEDDSGWIGKLVEIYAGTVPTKSGDMDAVLVRAAEETDVAAEAKAVKAAKARASKAKSSGGGMDDEIPFAPEWRG